MDMLWWLGILNTLAMIPRTRQLLVGSVPIELKQHVHDGLQYDVKVKTTRMHFVF
jgi:hypothetical protein